MRQIQLLAVSHPRFGEHKNTRNRKPAIASGALLARAQSGGNLDDVYPFHTPTQRAIDRIRTFKGQQTAVFFDNAWHSKLPHSVASSITWLFRLANQNPNRFMAFEQSAAEYTSNATKPSELLPYVRTGFAVADGPEQKLQVMSKWHELLYRVLVNEPDLTVTIPSVTEAMWLTQFSAITQGNRGEDVRLEGKGTLDDARKVLSAMFAKLRRMVLAQDLRAEQLAGLAQDPIAREETVVMVVSYAMARTLESAFQKRGQGDRVELSNLALAANCRAYDQWAPRRNATSTSTSDLAVLQDVLLVYLEDWLRESGVPALFDVLADLPANTRLEWFKNVVCRPAKSLEKQAHGLLERTIEWLRQRKHLGQMEEGWLWDGPALLDLQ